MTAFNPTLSVITIVYNNARDIERTMLSVLNQTYPNIEYIIIDGKSNDGTLDIISQYKNDVGFRARNGIVILGAGRLLCCRARCQTEHH